MLEKGAFVSKKRLERQKFTAIISTQGFDRIIELGLDPREK